MSNSGKIWLDEERAGLEDTDEHMQRIISVPKKSGDSKAGNFDLYYFVPKSNEPPNGRTLLFCSGGPGRTLKPGDDLWFKTLSKRGYNVVFFHLRGCGFSQLPADTESDKYLRSEYAINDIEEIRKRYLGNKEWDGIIGYSYGAVLAQRYANLPKGKLRKVILIGPVSLDQFSSNPVEAYKNYEDAVKKIRQETVTRIYKEVDGLKNYSGDVIKRVIEKLFGSPGIYQIVDEKFGAVESIVESYDKLKESGALQDLRYTRQLFEALAKLRKWGWKPLEAPDNVKETLEGVGKILAQELGGVSNGAPGAVRPVERAKSTVPRAVRAFEVIRAYDGLNRRFMKEWLSMDDRSKTPSNFQNVLERSVGDAQKEFRFNRQISKVGISPEDIRRIEPWDPARYPHSLPTLILKGGADPVTAGGQAERYFCDEVCSGPRVFMEFEGIGHEFSLPRIEADSLLMNVPFRGKYIEPIDCIVDAFIDKEFGEFVKVVKDVADKLDHKDVAGAVAIGR
jgi:pimeloyl-ACP methyl ester carboxylesterase